MILWLMMAVAAAAQLTLELDTREMVVGQTVPLTLQLVNGKTRGQPSVPVGEGLSIQFTGQSTQNVVVNFQSTHIVRFSYQLSALQPGRWTIGPVELQQGTETVRADPITVEVGEPPVGQGDAPVLAMLSDANPVLGQVVVYRFQFRHDKPVVNARWSPPQFDGFIEEQIAESSQREYQVSEDGKTFTIQTIEVPLVAAGAGARTVPPAVLTAQYRSQRRRRGRRRTIDDLFGDSPFATMGNVKTLSHSTLPLSVEILPLPDGAPPSFGGLVGRFVAEVTSDVSVLEFGESATLEYRISGDGTLAGFRLPSPPPDAGFRVYDDAPEVNAKVSDGRFLATALVRRAVVPEAEGRLTIPPVRLSVFDPSDSTYKEVVTPSVILQVGPGEPGAGVVESYAAGGGGAQRAVASLGEDILPVSAPDRVRNATFHGALPVMVALPGLPLFAWLSLILAGWVGARRVDPRVVLNARLRQLPSDPAARLAEIESVFREAAGLRLGRPAPGLDREGVSALGDEATALYDALVQARYGGESAELDALVDEVRRFMEAR